MFTLTFLSEDVELEAGIVLILYISFYPNEPLEPKSNYSIVSFDGLLEVSAF